MGDGLRMRGWIIGFELGMECGWGRDAVSIDMGLPLCDMTL